MNIIDIILIILLAFGAYSGYKKGLLVEIVSFLALIIAVISAFKLLHTGIQYLKSTWGWESVLIPFVAFLLIFALVYFAIYLLAKALKKAMDYTLFGGADNIAGALLGMVKMAFGISIVLWLVRSASIEFPKEFISESLIFKPLVEFAPKAMYYVSYVIPLQNIFPAIQKLLKP